MRPLARLAAFVAALGCALGAGAQGVLWSAAIPGPGDSNGAVVTSRMVVDAAGDVIAFGGFETNHLSSRIFVVKYSGADGSERWRQLIGTADDAGRGIDLAIAPDGTLVLAAAIPNGANLDFLTARLRADTGQVLAYRLFDSGGDDVPVALALDRDGSPVVTGRVAVDFGSQAWHTIKYDAALTRVVWQRRIGGEALQNDTPTGVLVDSRGDVVVAGRDANGVNGNFRVIKHRGSDGAVLWDTTFDSGLGDDPTALAFDGAGALVVAGNGDRVVHAIKYDAASGAVLWQRTLIVGGGWTSALGLAIDRSGHVVLAGASRRLSGTGFEPALQNDLAVVKLAASDGATLWERLYQGPQPTFDDLAIDVKLDAQGDPLVLGWSGGETIVLKLASSTGNVQWEYRDTKPSTDFDDFPRALAVARDAVVVASIRDPFGAPGSARFVKLANAPARTLPARPFDLDGLAGIDVLWQDASGTMGAWLMNGIGKLGNGMVVGGMGATLLASADFDGDGRADLLLREASGAVTLRLMDGTLGAGAATILPAGSGWSVAHLAQVGVDRRPDLVLRHDASGIHALLLGSGASQAVASPGPGWSIAHVADFTGDGRSDALWVHAQAGVRLSAGFAAMPQAIQFAAMPAPLANGWRIAHVADFNGDGRKDLLWAHPDGRHALWLMSATPVLAFLSPPAGTAWTARLTGDFDGDGKADIVWTHAAGEAALWLMDGATPRARGTLIAAGSGWTPALAADFDRDGKSDLLWTHADGSAGVWKMDGLAPVAASGLLGPGTSWRPLLPALPAS